MMEDIKTLTENFKKALNENAMITLTNDDTTVTLEKEGGR